MIEIEIHPEAEKEMNAAAQFYEKRANDLGVSFLVEVEKSIHRIFESPTLYPILKRNIRRCLIHRFPYAVLYALNNEKVLVLAIMHLHRSPRYWTKRI